MKINYSINVMNQIYKINMLVMQYEGVLKNGIKKKINSLTVFLLTMFNWINETMIESDKVWRLLHQRYGMSQIVKKYIHLKLKTALTLLLLMMFCWIEKNIDESDEVCWWLHQNIWISRIIQKLHLIGG